jgi:hypothetical protein
MNLLLERLLQAFGEALSVRLLLGKSSQSFIFILAFLMGECVNGRMCEWENV